MELIADGLLLIGAATASLYCMVLSRRLRRLSETENGIGGAIAAMSARVDEMNDAVARARRETEAASAKLEARLGEARQAAERLEAAAASARDETLAMAAPGGEAGAPPARRRSAARSKAPAKAPAKGATKSSSAAKATPPAGDGRAAARSARPKEDTHEALARRLIAALTGAEARPA